MNLLHSRVSETNADAIRVHLLLFGSTEEFPSSQAFGGANGGEFRKSFHGYAPGYVQVQPGGLRTSEFSGFFTTHGRPWTTEDDDHILCKWSLGHPMLHMVSFFLVVGRSRRCKKHNAQRRNFFEVFGEHLEPGFAPALPAACHRHVMSSDVRSTSPRFFR